MDTLKFVGILLVAILAGCGGGSGSSPANVSNSFSIGTLSPQFINMVLPKLTSTSGNSVVSLTASYTGNTTDNVYVLIEDPDNIVIAGTVIVNNNSTATLTLYLDQNVALGTYTQPIRVRACKDIACATEIAGSPQTIQKNIVVSNITVSPSTLSFTSSAGMAPSAQSVTVTVPSGLSFSYTNFVYVEYTSPTGSTGLIDAQDIFTITTTASSIQLQPKAYYEGHYVLRLYVSSVGFEDASLVITYEVGAATTQNLTVLTTSATQSGTVNSSADIPIYIQVIENTTLSALNIVIVYDPSIPLPSAYPYWLRYYDSTSFTDGSGPANNGRNMRFFANACFSASLSSCLAAGTYKASILLTSTSFGFSNTYTIPVTFTVN